MPEPWEEYRDEVDDEKVESYALGEMDKDDARDLLAREKWEEDSTPVEIIENHDHVVEVIEDTTRAHTMWIVTDWETDSPGDIGINTGDFADSIHWMELRHIVRARTELRITNTREHEGQFTVTVSEN